MKISKSVLQAIAVAVTLGTTNAACSLVKDEVEASAASENCDETCAATCDGNHENKNFDPSNCPACGMG